MSVFGHLKELRKRLLLALLGISVGAVGGWLLYDPIMDYITGPLLDMEDASTVINFPTIGGGLDLKLQRGGRRGGEKQKTDEQKFSHKGQYSKSHGSCQFIGWATR